VYARATDTSGNTKETFIQVTYDSTAIPASGVLLFDGSFKPTDAPKGGYGNGGSFAGFGDVWDGWYCLPQLDSLVIVPAPGGRPGYAAKFTQRPGINYDCGGNQHDQISWNANNIPNPNKVVWWGWSQYFDTTYNVSSVWSLIGWSPVSKFYTTPNTYTQIQAYSSDSQNKISYNVNTQEGLIFSNHEKGVWYDWAMKVDFERDATGYIEFWVKKPTDPDYVLVASKYNFQTDYPYLTYETNWYMPRFGMYRGSASTVTQIIYYLNPKIGTTRASVEYGSSGNLPPVCAAPSTIPCGNGVIDLPDEVCDKLGNISCPANSSCNSSCTVCVPNSCVPSKTCADYPFKCGANLFNGCSNTLDCSGSCTAPASECNVSTWSCQVPLTAPTTAPTITAAPLTKAVELRWTPVSGSGYKVYKDGVLIATVKGLYFRYVPGDFNSHDYQVSAYNSVGEGPKSAIATMDASTVPVANINRLIPIDSFKELIANVFKWSLSIIGGLALLMIMIGGIMYMGATGEEQKTIKAKKTLAYALVGLVLILLAYSISFIIERIFG
ncbi:MAG: heparin lyase I family protein, partial [Minisyncoccia bacterium]